MSSFLILALASSALAVPYHGHQQHQHQHHKHFFSTGVPSTGTDAPFLTGTGAPFPIANATGFWGTGSAASTGLPVSVASESAVAAISEVAAVDASGSALDSSTSCTRSTTFVTTTNRVTVTVLQTDAAASAIIASASSDVSNATETHASATKNGTDVDAIYATASSSSSASASASASVSITMDFQNKKAQNFKFHGRSSTTVSSSSEAPATASSTSTTSTEAPASTSSTSTSIYVAPTSSSVVVSSTTSSSTASQSSTSSSGKRGVAYNDATLAALFEDNAEVTWAYNWGSSSSGLSSSFNYVPLLWGTADTFTSGWDDAVTTALAAGSTHLMSFNEPDDSSQSDLTPAAAAAAYKTYMQPYAGQAKLGAPAVTNGGGSMGLDWLAAFLDACDGCTIDFVAIHWYDSYSNTAYFQEQVQNASSISGNLPVWVTEFGTTDGTDAEISSFLETVMPWMDEQDYVEAYSYFMASDGLLVSGTELSSYGSTFATYTS